MKISTVTLLFLALLFISYSFGDNPNPKLIGPNDPGQSHFPQFEGLKMHIRCYSSPLSTGKTVLFDAGMPWFCTAFAKVIELLIPEMQDMGIKKACFFDRYGLGWSDLAPQPIQSIEFARRLHGSLQVAGIQGPYIYSAWSWGGVDAQFFALLFPNDIQGLLTIDGTDRGLAFDTAFQANLPYFSAEVDNLMIANPTGQLRIDAENGLIPQSFGWTPDYTPIPANSINYTQEIFLDPSNKFLMASKQEIGIMVPSAQLLDSTYTQSTKQYPLGSIPFHLIVATVSGEYWVVRQEAMAQLSSNSRIHRNNVSSHFVVFDDPEFIIDSLGSLIANINNNPPTTRSGTCSSNASTSSTTSSTTTGFSITTIGTTSASSTSSSISSISSTTGTGQTSISTTSSSVTVVSSSSSSSITSSSSSF
ncbi:hypothetical protein DLAC_11146 [Tieghemostelium lacteum]|uniref:AB hydrolase-1 domain-containing protein n=1 Tax=Tieghemostelium lacteum TaxID=361077 RepID=A0A151Z3B7_TIELA|nr:hypothetical protein DLAC_11146 [Tieghemostelium lacteum]|eukprot:KYQ88441.1 hypothetical protein DLAC_11146 [Tieghemostelium lacteum]